MAGNRRINCVHVLILVLSLIVIISTMAQDSAIEQLQTASEHYLDGRYQETIAIYEGLIEQGWDNSEIYYNLGNTYYHSGQIGYALLNYRRAQVRNPRDTELNKNLARVRSERTTFQQSEQAIIDRVASATVDFITLRELAVLGLITWVLMFAIAILVVLRNNRTPTLLIILISFSLFAIVCNGVLFVRLYATYQRPSAIVLNLNVNIYSGPGDDYLILGQLHAGTECRIIERKGIWRRFILPNGDQGWIIADNIEEV